MGIPSDPGLIPRIASNLFTQIHNFSSPSDTCTIHISYFEIYNEQVRDLLAAQPQTFSAPDSKVQQGGLRVRERKDGTVFVEGLNEFQCKGFEDVLAFMKVGNKVCLYIHGLRVLYECLCFGFVLACGITGEETFFLLSTFLCSWQ